MRLKSIEINNFFSIGNINLDFANYDGLIEIIGDNQDNDFALSNGAGKSSFLDALYWGFTGHTLRPKIPVDAVVHRKFKADCYVKILFEINDIVYQILRYRKHSEFENTLFFGTVDKPDVLTKTSNTATQDAIQNVIQLTPSMLKRVLFFGSNDVQSFLEMDNSELTVMFEKLLDFENINIIEDRIKQKIKDVEFSILEFKGKIRDCDILIQEKSNNVKKSKQRVEVEKENVNERIQYLNSKTTEVDTYKMNKQKIIQQIDSINSKRGDYDNVVNVLIEKKSKLNGYNINVSNAKKRVDGLELEVDRLRNFVIPENCEYCGRPYNKSSISLRKQKIKTEVREKIEILKEERKKYNNYLKMQEDLRADVVNLEDVKKSYNDLFKNEKTLKAELNNIEKVLVDINRHYDNIDYYKKYLQQTVENVEKEISLIEKAIESLVLEKDGFADEQMVRENYLNTLKDLLSIFSANGVKKIYYDTIIPVLNTLLADFLNEMGMPGVTIYKKIMRNNWTIGISFSDNTKYNEYFTSSDGEKTKLNLAVSLAFYVFIREFLGQNVNVFFMDEPFNNLDDVSAESVVKLLEKVTEHIDCIFIISHNHNLKDIVEKKLYIEKKDGISSLKEVYDE